VLRAERRFRVGSVVGVQQRSVVHSEPGANDSEPGDRDSEPGDNEVRLRGVLVGPAGPSPSADDDTVFSLQVPGAPGRKSGDRFDCRTSDAALSEASLGWLTGARVEVCGSLRRRFFRAGGATVSKVEVHVVRAHLIAAPDAGEAVAWSDPGLNVATGPAT